MGVQTGRTVQDFTKLFVSDGAVMREVLINSLGDLGFDYPETDMSAWSDAVKGYLVGKPDFVLTFGGPSDNTATTGTSTVLRGLVGKMTPLSFDVQVGVRHPWEAGEQQFGMTATATSGCIVTQFKEAGGMYTATLRLYPGSAIPAWGIAAETVS